MAKKKILPKIILWLVIAVFCVGLAFCTVTVINGRKMYKDAIKRTSVQQMYDEISSREGYVRIDTVSPVFLDAIIAIEDHRFYEHSGYDLVSIGRAIIDNIISGGYASGGSTITQQTAKNLWFTQEKFLERKVAEVFTAVDMEKELGKDKILELYINISFFGRGCYGVGNAAETFFETEPSELTLGQSAYLAGLLQAPSIYSVDEEKALQRYEKVINAMKQYDLYPEEEN